MRHEDSEIRSISDLVCALVAENTGEPIWFRGQADQDWKLLPSIVREPLTVDAEMALIKRFMQNAGPFLLNRPATTWEWLMLMQHHRVPTRLLDWTESPLVGLFFAVELLPEQPGALWCLLPTKLNEQAHITYGYAGELPSFAEDEVLGSYLPERISAGRLTRINPIAVIGPRNTPRMYAQMGAFTLAHLDRIAIEDVGDGEHVWRLVVPAQSKERIKRELRLLKVTRLSLFPELDYVGEVTREVLQ